MKKFIPSLLAFVLLAGISVALLNVHKVSATTTTSVDAGATIKNPFKGGGNLEELFVAILNGVVIPIGAVAVVLGFIYTGFLFVKAQGNDKELPQARGALLNTVIGAIILLGAGVIANVIGNTINQLKAS
ncbi:MAG: hypothetical protein WAV25_01795 [Minisyncoccia bacterium]